MCLRETGYENVNWIELVRNRVGYNGGFDVKKVKSLILGLFKDVVSTAHMQIQRWEDNNVELIRIWKEMSRPT
jgi:hypothetical protein